MLKTALLFLLFLTFISATNVCAGTNCEARFINPGTNRILAGDPSERNTRPFQVALYKRVGTTGELGFCGGSLIHPEWVLTAAHCCFHGDQIVDNVQAILGAHSLYDRYENGRRIVNVAEIVVHPDFQPTTFSNDVALLRLANTMQLTDTIDIVRLPYLNISSFSFAGLAAIVSGWGIPAEGVTFVSPILRQKSLTVATDQFCDTFYQQELPVNTVCGVDNVAGAGTCRGDNGGPFTIYHNATEETVLIGVASFVGADGCSIERPSVFTRVGRYLPWIAETTGIELI